MKKTLTAILLLGLGWTASAAAAQPATAPSPADRAALEQLLTGDYPRALDQRNWAAYAALFTADGELVTQGKTVKGRAEIEKNFSQPALPSAAPAAQPGEIRTMHIVTNLSFRIEADKAIGGAYWQTVGKRDGLPAILGAGHYEDVLKKDSSGQWKFVRRVIANDISGPPRAAATTPSAAPVAETKK
ncbi:MAG: nuclear transport factor 2 family protein [Steroidobacteraceae bacterium]